MRIIHLIPGTADPNTANGVNKVVHWLATNMVAQGHECEVWALLDAGEAPSHARTYKLTVFPRSKSRFKLSDSLRSALAELPPDAWIHLHSVFVPELTSAAKLLHKKRASFGITPHGGYLSERKGRSIGGRIRKRLFLALWEGWTLRNASLIHAIGQTEVDDLKSRYPSLDRIALIPNGFELPTQDLSSQDSNEHAQAVALAEPMIVYCGRLAIFQKGLDILLEGFAIYRKAGGTLKLMMVGSGSDRQKLESLAGDYGVADAVVWAGGIFGTPLRSLLSKGTVFVHSSRFDVIPTACLEAASCGLPLLVTEETNLGEYVRQSGSGMILNPNTPTSLAETLRKVESLSATDLSRMGASAKSMIDRYFTWSGISRRLSSAIEHATANGSHHP